MKEKAGPQSGGRTVTMWEKHMWEGSYGKEPFDLRLTVLRLIRNLYKIIIITLVGTLLFGGGYYVKNVLLRGEKQYAATSVYKVEYVEEPSKSGDYYINEMSWNTYVQSGDFLDAVWKHLQEDTISYDSVYVQSKEQLAGMLQAKLASDLHIPSTIVTSGSPAWSVLVAAAVEETMTQEFAESNREIASVHVMTPAETAPEVLPDVRPVRAVILSALLSCFFAVTIFLIKEIGADSIWLPVTLRRRYGLAVAGTLKSKELGVNLAYRFAGKKKIALCTVDEDTDPVEAAEQLRKIAEDGLSVKEWIPVPAPLLCTESAELLREMDGILLVVKAGSHAGKPLEYVLSYFTEQNISVTAALLWEADEALIHAYYLLGNPSTFLS